MASTENHHCSSIVYNPDQLLITIILTVAACVVQWQQERHARKVCTSVDWRKATPERSKLRLVRAPGNRNAGDQTDSCRGKGREVSQASLSLRSVGSREKPREAVRPWHPSPTCQPARRSPQRNPIYHGHTRHGACATLQSVPNR